MDEATYMPLVAGGSIDNGSFDDPVASSDDQYPHKHRRYSKVWSFHILLATVNVAVLLCLLLRGPSLQSSLPGFGDAPVYKATDYRTYAASGPAKCCCLTIG